MTTLDPSSVALSARDEQTDGTRDDGSATNDRSLSELRRLSRHLVDDEVRQLSSDTVVRFERIEGELVVSKTALSPASADRLRHEYQVLSEVLVTGVIETTSFTEGNQPTLTSRFAGRTTAAQVLPDDVSTVARLTSAIAVAVVDLHRAGWAHGGLTADHCIVGHNAVVTLCSLGRAEHGTGYDNDRAAVVSIAVDLADQLPVSSGRRDRQARRTLRALLRTVPATDDELLALTENLDRLAARRATAGTAAMATTVSRRPPGADRREHSTPRPPISVPRRSTALALSAAGAIGFVALILGLRALGGPIDMPWSAARSASASNAPAVDAVIALLRIAAVAAATYGAVLCAVTFAAVVTGRADVANAAAKLASPRVRALLIVLLGVGACASAVAPSTGATAHEIAEATPFQARSADIGDASAPPSASPGDLAATAIGVDAVDRATQAGAGDDAAPDSVNEGAITSTADDAVGSDVPAAVPAPTTAGTTWTVERGDHLWSIAERVLTDRLGATPDDDVIAMYWISIINANHDVLIDAENPDLIAVGQVFALPPITA